MDVTLDNFKEALPEILAAIDSCDFIAIDGEFTGLRNGPDVTAYDTPAVYYSKVRDGSLNFLLVQVGLCTFKFDRVKNKYVYKAYNFYVFPRTVGRNSNEVNFLCQASSISFLCGAGFDFNKLFREGIPYLNIADEEALQQELTAKYDNLNQSESSFTKIPIPQELVSTVEDACSRIEKFLSPENTEKEIIFDRCNGFIRKLIFQTAYERFPGKNFCLNTKWVDNNALLVAQKGKSKAEQEKENYEKDKNEIAQAVGFSIVIKHISNSKKLIVGHNMLLDICHIVNRFCFPLPENYWEFKEIVHHLFPKLIDTKYMCSAYPFRDLIPSSVMDHMIKRLHDAPFEFGNAESESADLGYSMENSKQHEAGYDAYLTGLAFISLTSYLGRNLKNVSSSLNPALFKEYENRLFLMRIMDYSFMNLKGEEPKPSRIHVFHITFPKEWKTSDITQLFNSYGNVHVSYCSQTTAWVTLLKPEKSAAVVTNIIESNLNEAPGLRKPYTVVTWAQFWEENTLSKNRSLVRNRQSEKLLSSPTCSPVLNRTVAVCQPGGDAEPSEAEAKSPNKRSTTSDDGSRKRKKSGQPSSTEDLSSGESVVEIVEVPATPIKKRHDADVHPSPSKCNLLFEQVKGAEDSIQKTFEEPAWE